MENLSDSIIIIIGLAIAIFVICYPFAILRRLGRVARASERAADALDRIETADREQRKAIFDELRRLTRE